MIRAALSIWILSALLCFARSDHHGDHDHHSQDHLFTRNHNLNLVSSANKDFAFRLYKKLTAQNDLQGKNIFFSPISVTLALAALSVGARGDTYDQLFTGLGFNNSLLTQADVDNAFQSLLTGLNDTSQEDLSAGTAVFVGETFQPKAQYMKVVKQSYLADGFSVDFTNTTESIKTINQYVEEKTKGKIEKLVTDLDSSTILYLVSFMYFNGTWKLPFDPRDTKQDVFHVDEQTEVPVQMMYFEEVVHTYYDHDIAASILHLQFNGFRSMLLVLPNAALVELDEVICQNNVNKWLKWMKEKETKVYLPKFSMKMSYSLKDVLGEMGVQEIFGAAANLSGISEEKRLAVSEVVHQATLEVNESGATAAAATGVKITPLSFRRIPVLKFNRPFMVFIKDNSGNILFIGKVVNPNI